MRLRIGADRRLSASTAFNYYRRVLYRVFVRAMYVTNFSERTPTTSKMVNWHDPVIILRDYCALPIRVVALTRCRADKLRTSHSHQAASRSRQCLHVRSRLVAGKAHTDLDLHL